jgi:hypothetical protein
VIILGAFYVQSARKNSAAAQGAIVTAAPERQYIATTDANGDGIEDWKNSIALSGFDPIATPTSSLALQTDESYTAPTTFTGKFAQAFFTDYMEGKVSGADLKNKEQLIGNAVTAIEANTRSKIYTQKDIVVIPDSGQALHEYGNHVAEIILKNSINNENEAVILKRALDTNDKDVLKDLIPIRNVYEKMIAESLLVPTPASLAMSHAELLSAYESIRTDIAAMERVFDDPLLTMSRIKRYEDDASGLFLVFKKIGTTLISAGVSYEKDEPGSLVYTLNI